ncbi:MAG: hypothetical protein KC586_04490 [Myxococcales bacterium]|nr:hypothetical protein [Myxococcales bacterium]
MGSACARRDPDHCGACGRRCADGEGCVDGVCCGVATEQLDVLVLVENDDLIADLMQRTLLRDLPALLRPLMTGDHDRDGRIDHPPVADLHLGVITADIGGSSEASLPRCGEGLGDDGLLLEREPPRRNGCDEVRPPFLQWRGTGDPDEFVRQVGCATRMGVLGCDVLQPLEAVLKALTPSSSPIRFFDGTRGHGDRAHADFLRPDSFLLVLIVSTEDDCSASDPQLYDLYDHDTPLDLLCIDHPEWLFETSRYVQGYAALRPPGRFHFAVLGGAPPDLVSESDDYSTILADPRMFPEGDPLDFRYVRPLCEIEPL